MHTSKKGFFFIEGSIMVVIAGVGILSAAMFPAMTGYLTRSRDATRISHLSIVATAVQSYYIDKNTYPDTPSSGCLPKEALKEYLPNIPLDPTPERLSSGCDGSDGMTYSYTSYVASDKSAHYILTASMESVNSGNSPLPTSQLSLSDSGTINSPLVRGSGKEYILHY